MYSAYFKVHLQYQTKVVLDTKLSEFFLKSLMKYLLMDLWEIEINDLIYFFKCFKKIYKLNIFDYVSFRSCIKLLRNIDYLTLDVPFRRTDVSKNSFFVWICRLWNELPLSIRESNTLSIFCKNLVAFYHDKFNVDFLNFTLYFTKSLVHL